MQHLAAQASTFTSDAEPAFIDPSRQSWTAGSDQMGHRITALTAQLLRAEDPEVVELVAAELQGSIRHYVEGVRLRLADSVPLLTSPTLQNYT